MFASSRKSLLSCALLAAAVAGGVGLVGGSGTADAQLIVALASGTNPKPTNVAGVYDWTYNVTFYGNVTPPTGTNSDYILMTGFSSADWLSGTQNAVTISGVSSTDWSFSQVTGVGNPVYNGLNVTSASPTNIQGLEITFNGYKSGDASIVSGTTGTISILDSLNSNNVDTYYFNLHQDTPTTGYAGNSSTIMPASVNITGQPLPVPAALWPGLGTLAVMALVGGLRLRKRFA